MRDKYDYIFLDGELECVDGGMGILILQLNLSGIKTLGSCSGHGRGYPNVTCAPGTREKLIEFGCKIAVVKENRNVEAYFPCACFRGRIYPVKKKEGNNDQNEQFLEEGPSRVEEGNK